MRLGCIGGWGRLFGDLPPNREGLGEASTDGAFCDLYGSGDKVG